MVQFVNFEEYLQEKNKFKLRGPKRKFKKRLQYQPPPHKELGRVEPASARRHSAQVIRSDDRKTLRQLAARQRPLRMYGISPSTEKLVQTAKKAPAGFIRRLTKIEAYEIAMKYKFNIPDQKKPIKHLGSTGIEMFRRGPNQYYLIRTYS